MLIHNVDRDKLHGAVFFAYGDSKNGVRAASVYGWASPGLLAVATQGEPGCIKIATLPTCPDY